MINQIITGDALETLRTIASESVQCCVTSPPYYGLRDYGVEGQIGLEETPAAYVEKLVTVFHEVRRILRDDGTLWVNLGDSYVANKSGSLGDKCTLVGTPQFPAMTRPDKKPGNGLKSKDLIGIPWMVAFALRSDGWYLRSNVIWHKPTAMPESVTDRPTTAHEHIFLLAKSARYFYDADAIREPLKPKTFTTFGIKHQAQGNDALGLVKSDNWGRTVVERQPKLSADGEIAGANKRTVWTVASQPYSEAHFATFPPKLIEPCILAGSRPGDTVLDCFMGAGTVALVAIQHHRNYLGVELNPVYVALAEKRIAHVQQNLWACESEVGK